MDLYNEVDGPTLDVGVEKRLLRLDPNLRVTFSKWVIDGLTGRPIIFLGTQRPVESPAYYLWVRGGEGRFHLVNTYPAHAGFGHREVAKLEADCARFMTPSELFRMVHRKQKDAEERAKVGARQHRADVAKANKKRIADLVFDGKSGKRQAKISSFGGQTVRSTPGTVMSDARSDGWEIE